MRKKEMGWTSEKLFRDLEKNEFETSGCGGTESIKQNKRAPWASGVSVLASPVPIEKGLAQTLGTGLMEPLQAAPALQHFQVPPEGEHRTSNLQTFSPLTAPNPTYHPLPCPSALPNPVLSPSFPWDLLYHHIPSLISQPPPLITHSPGPPQYKQQ